MKKYGKALLGSLFLAGIASAYACYKPAIRSEGNESPPETILHDSIISEDYGTCPPDGQETPKAVILYRIRFDIIENNHEIYVHMFNRRYDVTNLQFMNYPDGSSRLILDAQLEGPNSREDRYFDTDITSPRMLMASKQL